MNSDVYLELQHLSRKLVECQVELLNIYNKETDFKRDITSIPEYSIEWNEEPLIIKIIINEFPPRIKVHPDIISKPNKKHDSSYKIVRDRWYNLIFNAVRELPQNIFNKYLPLPEALVWITFYIPQNIITDVDNFTIKFINDAIVLSNINEDDNYKAMSMILQGKSTTKDPRTEIIICNQKDHLDTWYEKITKNLSHT